ncbi:hypothetical protein CERZMDRAFT_91929 [Cercospora zeae-maydis SCOH1-5]|uniref:Uncharacterized protein n=1 Tax=Cercospora zeae-maydis SCOH1-5 TaxID=717836 RepID=A0A6A6EZ53_9PEZI|nr:hypothetical protein CERZMDRAFT_91929 [Cercospora zeae-maydis SCOH1-5]
MEQELCVAYELIALKEQGPNMVMSEWLTILGNNVCALFSCRPCTSIETSNHSLHMPDKVLSPSSTTRLDYYLSVRLAPASASMAPLND